MYNTASDNGSHKPKPALMPNCPFCGNYNTVVVAECKDRGSHYCAKGCGRWFTPVKVEPELTPNCPMCGQHDTVKVSEEPNRNHGSHFCGMRFPDMTTKGCGVWFTPVNENAKQADAALDAVIASKLLSNAYPCTVGDAQTQPVNPFQTLDYGFLQAMDEVGILGEAKYGNESMAAKFRRGDFRRTDRTTDTAMVTHGQDHFEEFFQQTPHDHFGTRKHQLAAAAFNAMMLYIFFMADCKREL